VSRPTSIMIAALLGTTLTASVALGQQSSRNAPANPGAAPLDPMAASRGARHLLRNGTDYLSYQEYERALEFFREAEKKKEELSTAERQTLKLGIESAQKGMREAANAPRKAYAKTQVPSRPGAVATALAGPPRYADEPVQRTAVTVAEESTQRPASEPAARFRRPAPASLPESAAAPAPVPVALPAQAAPIEAAPPAQATASLEPSAGAPASTAAASRATDGPRLLASMPAPEAVPSAGRGPSAPGGESLALPPLPGEPVSPSAPPEPLPTPAGHSGETASVPALPADSTAAAPSERVAPPAGALPGFDALPQLPGESAPPGATAPTRSGQPAPRLAARGESDRTTLAQAAPAPAHSTLSPDLRRQVEHIARLQDEAAQRNAMTDSEQPTTQLELPRAPSPTEARPIRAIPVPEEFVPLAPRQWAPNRKYWAAAATCHAPLYFQDAALERYGHSVEQFFGPAGRCLTYPLDNPTQSNQRNQIVQPFMSAGLLVMQIVTLPYNMLVDFPWEAEYDLGYWRPGDRIPTDIYYLPWHGVGPPLHGMKY
jgi:hypothetical protein